MAVKGLKSVLGSLKKFGKEADESVEIITFATAKDIELNAKQLAPVNKGKHGGFLRQMIAAEEVDPKNWRIVAKANYSAYMEFGTGGLVSVPKELKEMAMRFKGGGIRQINITPRPFLYPSWKKGQKEYLKELKKELKLLTKKYN